MFTGKNASIKWLIKLDLKRIVRFNNLRRFTTFHFRLMLTIFFAHQLPYCHSVLLLLLYPFREYFYSIQSSIFPLCNACSAQLAVVLMHRRLQRINICPLPSLVILTRHSTFWLPLVQTDAVQLGRNAVSKCWKSTKMGRWLDCCYRSSNAELSCCRKDEKNL